MNKKQKAKKVHAFMQIAESQIKLCYVLAFITAGMTSIFTLMTLAGTSLPGYEADDVIFNLLVGASIAGLGFGLTRKSRVCAVILFAVFCIDKIIIFIVRPITTLTILITLVWGVAYISGVSGTFTYHKLKNAAPEPEQI